MMIHRLKAAEEMTGVRGPAVPNSEGGGEGTMEFRTLPRIYGSIRRYVRQISFRYHFAD
jgi:hypothetical protein